jgi:hypothetical protein
MPHFAVYYIPPAESALYRAGSEIMGYDAYTGRHLPKQNAARQHFTTFNEAWTHVPQEWGFHVTIGHALEYAPERLPEIEAEIEAILRLFDVQRPFTLVPDVPYLSAHPNNITLYYQANQAFMMFHALIIARVHALAVSSPLSRDLDAGATLPLSATNLERVRQYHHFGILDDWHPHFGLLRPLPTADRPEAERATLAALPTPTALTVDTICLLLKPDDATHFHVYRQFHRSDYLCTT